MIIPLQCEYFALEGLSLLLQTINRVQKGVNPHLKIGGILFTMYDSRTRLAHEVVQEVTGYFKEKVFRTIIPRNVRLERGAVVRQAHQPVRPGVHRREAATRSSPRRCSPMSKRALGKGIGALIGETEDARRQAAATVGGAALVPEAQPVTSPASSFRDASLAELADSIRQKGVLQPVLVEEVGTGGYHHRGGRAPGARGEARRARPGARASCARFSPEERLEIALIENLQREDLTPDRGGEGLPAADGGARPDPGAGGREGRQGPHHRDQQPAPAEAAREDAGRRRAGRPERRARAGPARRDEPRRPAGALRSASSSAGLSVRETEQAAAALNQGRRGGQGEEARRAARRDPDVREVEERLVERFGTKVQIRGGPARGRIEIAYFSADDLERVIELLQGRK